MSDPAIKRRVSPMRWIIGIVMGLVVLGVLLKKARAPKSNPKTLPPSAIIE